MLLAVSGAALHEASLRLEAFVSQHYQPQSAAVSMMMFGWWRAVQRKDRDGITQLRQGIKVFQQSAGGVYGPSWLARLAEAYAQVGQYKEALDTIAEASEVMHATGEYVHHAELHWLKGRLLLMFSDSRDLEAETCFKQTIKIAQDQASKSWELRAATSLARLWQSQDKCQDAHDLLAPVYGWFTEGFDTADLKDAKALLTELRA